LGSFCGGVVVHPPTIARVPYTGSCLRQGQKPSCGDGQTAGLLNTDKTKSANRIRDSFSKVAYLEPFNMIPHW
jgi:hypothetical protein